MDILIVIMDGISGRPTSSLNGLTSLQAADTPNLDRAADKGVSGIMDPISPGVRPGSDTSHLSLVGYNPYSTYTGRGPFEAAGVGIDVKEGDIAFRCNFATKKDGKIVDRRAGRINETSELSKAIQRETKEIDGIKVIFRESTGHRGALVLRGEGLSSRITGSDPKKPGLPTKKIKAIDPVGDKTAEIANKFIEKAESVLENHPHNKKRIEDGLPPANTVLLRGVGEVPSVVPIQDKHGLDSAIISGTGLMKGIGKLIGMDVIEVEGATGSKDSNTMNKARETIRQLKENEKDFVLLHLKGGDEAGHDGDGAAKIQYIEEKIEPVIDYLLKEIEDTLLVLTADHSTPLDVKDHSGDPVPITIVGDGVRVDDVNFFNENTYKGGLLRIKGKDLMPICLDLTNKCNKYGA
ncbi:23-bisphosphoglycerate-independent phosphoglycerate mutase ApgM [Methanonatronarchaeum thermophilum]|uniref:2,3-bisphosphoglycerate-independent phosphoglycerate mutase n=1 Tax=Methanonatronarchaeum thermophilum TaxID=1927129 RepID=A0A1Y3GGY3_9EURY|nr:2,3-bisphosphoglycerate-independent phosphoglycerate mutase [Methanonatronarchaeum thermophilum]OUJ18626.1 23-bisphosphoglycerate-independent phosphoglycerate mutase ApgM [Methanonatronarchaeum thermophilum]